MIITHRGRNTNFRENTIESFEEALELGCQGVECDLRLTLDNRAVAYHDKNLALNGKKVSISKIPFDLISSHKLLAIEELFEYINYKNVPFYLELKSLSKVLTQKVIEKIKMHNLWEKVYIIGFPFFISKAVDAQSKYPKLKVIQILPVPLHSYVRRPRCSFGVAFGWFDKWFGSEWSFRKLISVERLSELKKFYERNGFKKIMAGVINREDGFEYFDQAGITDIVTDNVFGAVNYFKKRKLC